METESRRIWSAVWIVVACVGLIAILLGHWQHIATFAIATILAIIVSCDDDDRLQLR